MSVLIVNDSAQGPLAKSKAIETLKKAQDAAQEELAKVDKDLKAKVTETQTYQVSANNTSQERAVENRWFSYSESLSVLSGRRQESLQKQKVLNQIMFEIDSKWNGQGMRTFLEHTFMDLSLNEMTDDNPEVNRALFYTYLSVAMRELPEKAEDLIGFMVGYINFSGISKPKPPLAFVNSRNYSNGSKSVTARSTKSEAISELVERRMKVVEELRASNSKLEDDKNSSDAQEEGFDESKVIKPKASDKLKPSASATIINIAPNRVSEVLMKD